MTADFDREQTPTAKPGTCFRKCGFDAVPVKVPVPGSRYEVERIPICIAGTGFDWCPAHGFVRFGTVEFYLGPDRREAKRIPFDTERRRVPVVPPREDDK